MKVTVIVPEDYMGDVIGDLNSRRGHDPRHGCTSGCTADQCNGSAVRDVRLRNRYAFQDTGPWSVHHGAKPLCRGSEVYR